MDSPELKSLKECNPILVSCIQLAPDDIVTHLIPLDLLPQQVLSSVSTPKKKAQEVVDAVKFQVESNSFLFESFLQALTDAGPWTKSTVNELREKRNSYWVRTATTSDSGAISQSQQSAPMRSPANVATDLSSDNRITASHPPGMPK